jgi:hypothetical protein
MSQNMLGNGHLIENAEHVTHNLPVRLYPIMPPQLYDYKHKYNCYIASKYF